MAYMMQPGMRPGGIIKIRRQAGYAKQYDGDITDEQFYDDYVYDHSKMAYVKIESVPDIYKKQQEEVEKKSKVKSLIAYYYNR